MIAELEMDQLDRIVGWNQDLERLLIACSRVTHRVRQALNGLYILREDVEPGVHDHLDVLRDAAKVRRQSLHRGARIELPASPSGCRCPPSKSGKPGCTPNP